MDLHRLDLNLLVTLALLFEERSVSRVAQRLRVSQPTVSFALRKLRDFFDDQLFVRSAGIMIPTARAETLRDGVRRLMVLVEEDILTLGGFDPLSTTRTFVVSTSDIGELVFLPPLLEALAIQAPRASLSTVSMRPGELHAAMAAGQVDLALGYFPDFAGDAFFEQSLFDHSFACLVRRNHPQLGPGMTLRQYLAADHAVVAQEGRSQEILERTLKQRGLSRHVRFTSQHFMTVPLLIAHSDMIVTVPRAVALLYGRLASLQVLDVPFDPPPIPLKQFWHRRVHDDPGAKWVRSLVAGLFLASDPSMTGQSQVFDSIRNTDRAD